MLSNRNEKSNIDILEVLVDGQRGMQTPNNKKADIDATPKREKGGFTMTDFKNLSGGV